MKYCIATKNPGKIKEMKSILATLDLEGVSEAELRTPLPEVEETGRTFAENARLKAEAARRATGLPAIADDSGLSVDALHGAPGVYSARYAGEGATDAQRIAKLLAALEGVPETERSARFHCAICCAYPDGQVLTAEGICEGRIASSPSGTGGFGYDPVFLWEGQSFASLPPATKNTVSHRARALQALARQLAKR